MRKLVTVIFVSVFALVGMLALAFFYIDLMVHKGWHYEIFLNDSLCGSIKVDRYVTDRKIVFKAKTRSPFSLEYPSGTETLFLDKATKVPLRYVSESSGRRGKKMTKALLRDEEYADYLFIENPLLFKVERFPSGEKTSLFSSSKLLPVISLMERYNHWKKGTQFFEIMTLLDVPAPPFRSKAKVEYLHDEYIPVMGSRVHVEMFKVSSERFPEIKIMISKHSRQILMMEIPDTQTKFILLSTYEGPGKRIDMLLRNLPFVPVALRAHTAGTDEELPEIAAPFRDRLQNISLHVEGYIPPQEVFFESGKLILSGSLWIPEEKGPFRPVLIIPKDGPIKTGDKLMTDYLGSFLSRSGYVAMKFDGPGQGKSQGSFHGMDDSAKVSNIKDALRYLNDLDISLKDSTFVIVRGNGAYIALKSAEKAGSVKGCVLLAPEYENISAGFLENNPVADGALKRKYIRRMGLEVFGEDFASFSSELYRDNVIRAYNSRENFVLFSGIRLPLREYRSYIERDISSILNGFKKPLLILAGRDEPDLDVRGLEAYASVLGQRNPLIRVDVLRNGGGAYSGQIKKIDDRWEYVPFQNVFTHIRDWLDKNSPEMDREPGV